MIGKEERRPWQRSVDRTSVSWNDLNKHPTVKGMRETEWAVAAWDLCQCPDPGSGWKSCGGVLSSDPLLHIHWIYILSVSSWMLLHFRKHRWWCKPWQDGKGRRQRGDWLVSMQSCPRPKSGTVLESSGQIPLLYLLWLVSEMNIS